MNTSRISYPTNQHRARTSKRRRLERMQNGSEQVDPFSGVKMDSLWRLVEDKTSVAIL